MAQYEMNLRDYWRIIMKRKKVIVAVPIIVAFLVYIRSERPKDIYFASSQVEIQQVTDYTGLMIQSLYYQEGDNLSTHAENILSSPVLARVAKKMAIIPDTTLTPEQIWTNYKRDVQRLKGAIIVEPVGATNLLKITARSAISSEYVIKLANTVAQVYAQYANYIRNKQTIDAYNTLKRQIEEQKRLLEESENKLLEYQKVGKGIITFSADKLSELSDEYLKNESEIDFYQSQITALNELRFVPVEDVTFVKVFASPTDNEYLRELVKKLRDLEKRKNDLLVYHTPNSPTVLEIKKEIDEVIQNILQERNKILETMQKRQSELKKLLTELPKQQFELERIRGEVERNNALYTELRSSFQTAELRKAQQQNIVRVADLATYADSRPSGTGPKTKTFVGFIIGAALGLVIAFVMETFDTSIGTIEDVESYLETTVLGVIPHIDMDRQISKLVNRNPASADNPDLKEYASLVSHFDPKSPVSESYRTLRTNIEFAKLEKGGSRLLITSATVKEGKTITATNIAITMAQMGNKTLIINCDLRRPKIHRRFGLEATPGLTDVLLGTVTWQDAIKGITDIYMGKMDMMEDLMGAPGLDNLYILAGGNIPPNPSELLGSPRMTQLLDDVKEEFDMVILDCPPVLPVTDATILATRVDGVILVYQIGRIARFALKRAKVHIENVNAIVWGVVLNDIRAEVGYEQNLTKYYGKYYAETEGILDGANIVEKIVYRTREYFDKFKDKAISIIKRTHGEGSVSTEVKEYKKEELEVYSGESGFRKYGKYLLLFLIISGLVVAGIKGLQFLKKPEKMVKIDKGITVEEGSSNEGPSVPAGEADVQSVKPEVSEENLVTGEKPVIDEKVTVEEKPVIKEKPIGAVPVTSTGEIYSILVLSSEDHTTASGLISRLLRNGYKSYLVKESSADGSTLYKVFVGKFKSKNLAGTIARNLMNSNGFKNVSVTLVDESLISGS